MTYNNLMSLLWATHSWILYQYELPSVWNWNMYMLKHLIHSIRKENVITIWTKYLNFFKCILLNFNNILTFKYKLLSPKYTYFVWLLFVNVYSLIFNILCHLTNLSTSLQFSSRQLLNLSNRTTSYLTLSYQWF